LLVWEATFFPGDWPRHSRLSHRHALRAAPGYLRALGEGNQVKGETIEDARTTKFRATALGKKNRKEEQWGGNDEGNCVEEIRSSNEKGTNRAASSRSAASSVENYHWKNNPPVRQRKADSNQS